MGEGGTDLGNVKQKYIVDSTPLTQLTGTFEQAASLSEGRWEKRISFLHGP